LLHHIDIEAGAVSEDHVSIVPLLQEHIALNDFEGGCLGDRPAEELLVLLWRPRLHIVIIDGLQALGHILEGLEDLDTPAALELVHEGASKNSLSRAVAEVDECAAWDIVGVVPAVRVHVLPSRLDPLEDLVERFELDLAICQTDLLEAFLVALSATLCFTQLACELCGQ